MFDNSLGTKFWRQQEHLVTSVICCKFQTNLFEVWYYTILFMILYIYSPRAGADSPQGTKVWCQQKWLVTSFICCKFQKNVFEVWFYTILFHDLIHVYSTGTGADIPQGTKFWCQQKGLITLPICCKFQRNLFQVWFYTIFFHDLIHVYSPGAGCLQPPRRQSFDVNRNALSLRSYVTSFKS